MPGKGGDPPRKVNPIQVQKFLKGLDYPAKREDILKKAGEEGADEQVRATLERLPDRSYQTPAEVSKEIGRNQ